MYNLKIFFGSYSFSYKLVFNIIFIQLTKTTLKLN